MARTDDTRPIELAKCAADVAFFIHHFGWIDDSQGHGEGGGTMPFHLWPAQVQVAWQFMLQRLVLILKARQLGISWLCCGYALWLCLFQPGKVVLLFSKGQAEANELLRRIKVLYARLPPWMRDALPAVARDNSTEFGFANGSRVQSLPATESAGRSLTASLVILDEAAFLQFADALYTALKPTIDAGGQLIILSTANGVGNLFHKLWTRAQAGQHGFHAIFLPWWARPGRDAAWYAAQLAEYTDPQMVKQEYPASSTESFLVSGRVRFAAEWCARQAANVRAGLPQHQWPTDLQHVPGLTIYALPGARRTIIGADVAEGLEHGDFSAATVLDADRWEELAHLHGHWEPDVFGRYLAVLGTAYGAEVACERNNHGHTVLATLRALGYSRISNGHDERPGWLTNPQTKPQSIDRLAVALRDQLLTLHTQATLDELQIYRINANGTTGAPSGYFDDRVMSLAIAVTLVSRPSAPPPPLPMITGFKMKR